jgi:hypothetical protein
MGLDHRIVHVAAGKNFGKRMAHELAGTQGALGQALYGLGMSA